MDYVAHPGTGQPTAAAPILPLPTRVLAGSPLEYGCVDWFDYPDASDRSERLDLERARTTQTTAV